MFIILEKHHIMFTVATYNIHKGHSMTQGSRIVQLKAGLAELSADIICLQEVQEINTKRTISHTAWGQSQLASLHDNHYPYCVYGANAIYRHGDHGNAILSKYPIVSWQNIDVSDHRLEQRGLLHAVIDHPRHDQLHVICVHFGLFKGGRNRQAQALIAHIEAHVPRDATLIIAGDFNDWNLHVHRALTQHLKVIDAVEHLQQTEVGRTFPSLMPWFKLDRLYVRGLSVQSAKIHSGSVWRSRSDHAPICAQLI